MLRLIRDFLGTLDYLMCCCSLAHKGDEETIGEFMATLSFVKSRLVIAKKGLDKLQLYQEANDLLTTVDLLVSDQQYEQADMKVLNFARYLSEVSGQNDQLRKLYGGHKTDPNVH